MGLRPTHLGYGYQDLLTAIRLVDVAVGRADRVVVDTKIFATDRFDDITCQWRTGERDRLQIKHSSTDHALTATSFTGDKRGLRLDLLVESIWNDLKQHPDTTYRLAVRDTKPRDAPLSAVLMRSDLGLTPDPRCMD